MLKKKKKNELTLKEQKTSAAFKLQSERIKTLEKSLKKTQDELENYREKYHEADKNHALACSKNNVSALHEILKFVVSAVCGGIGANFISSRNYLAGFLLIIMSIILYSIITIFDKKQE